MTAETVSIPQEHAGVGAALRSAFVPGVSNMPSDIAILIEKLS